MVQNSSTLPCNSCSTTLRSTSSRDALHPRANGIAERTVQTAISTIKENSLVVRALIESPVQTGLGTKCIQSLKKRVSFGKGQERSGKQNEKWGVRWGTKMDNFC